MRGRPKKTIITPENLANNQYHQLAHRYAKLETAIEDLKDILADIELDYTRWMPDYTLEDKVYKMSNKMVFDNLKWVINDMNKQLSNYLNRLLTHADDLKWKDQHKEEKKEEAK